MNFKKIKIINNHVWKSSGLSVADKVKDLEDDFKAGYEEAVMKKINRWVKKGYIVVE